MAHYYKSQHLIFTLLLLAVFALDAQAQVTGTRVKEVPPPKPLNLNIPFSDWYELTSEDQSFKIKFPVKPDYQQSELKTALALVTHTYNLTDSPNHLFQLQIIEGTPGFKADLGVEGAIDAMSRYILEQGGKQLSRSSFEAQSTCKGTEIVMNFPSPGQSSGAYMHARAFRSGLNVYVLLYSAEADNSKWRGEALSFMNSIQLRGGCSSAVPAAEAPSTDVATGFIEGTKDPTSGWTFIKRDADGFSALMPGPVKHDTRQAQVQPIPLTLQQFTAKSGATQFAVNVVGPYPKRFFVNRTMHDVLLDASVRDIQNELASSKVELTFVKSLLVNGYPGREYKTVGPDGQRVGRLQLYSTPKYVIAAMVFDDLSEDTEEKFDRFFKSLKVDTSQPSGN